MCDNYRYIYRNWTSLFSLKYSIEASEHAYAAKNKILERKWLSRLDWVVVGDEMSGREHLRRN